MKSLSFALSSTYFILPLYSSPSFVYTRTYFSASPFLSSLVIANLQTSVLIIRLLNDFRISPTPRLRPINKAARTVR